MIDNGTRFAILAGMKNLLLAIVLAVSVTCQAETIVYKTNLTVKRNGAGATTSTKYAGFFLLGVGEQTGFAMIYADKKRMRYSVEDSRELSYQIRTVALPKGKQQLTVEDIDGQLSGLMMRGTIATFDVNGASYGVPKRMNLTGSDLFQLGETDWLTDDYKGVLSYDKKDTENEIDRTIDEVLSDVRSYFEEMGYTEETF